MALVAFALAGCAAPATKAKLDVEVETMDTLTRYERLYLLQPGDQLEIAVYRQPDFSRRMPIRPDGFIALPVINEIKAAGKTPRQLSADISELLSRRLRNPEVTVIVENAQEPMVFMVGEFTGPKALPLRQARTVAQALSQAGGTARAGDLPNVAIIRLNAKGFLESIKVKVEPYNADGTEVSQPEVYMALNNMPLQANDLVLVPVSYRGQFVRSFEDINTVLAPLFNAGLLYKIYSP
jgi:polysaccharide export outer membrane protein